MVWRISAAFEAPNLEARDWVSRVVANGGTVAVPTQLAVSNFCFAIEAEPGLRSAIARLNLFCGDNLNAALVPLYLAESFGAAAKGNVADANNNFVTGDYASTGVSGGLTGGGSGGTTKYLNTGLAQNAVGTSTSSHLSISGAGFNTSLESVAVGSYNGTENTIDDLNLAVNIGGGNIRATYRSAQFAGSNTAPSASWIHLIGSRTSATLSSLYSSGNLLNQDTISRTLARTTRPYFVFALNNIGSLGAPTSGRLRMYSIGSGLTAAQALAFSNAVSAFNNALGR